MQSLHTQYQTDGRNENDTPSFRSGKTSRLAGWTGCGRAMGPPPSKAGRLRPPQQRSRVFGNTEPLLCNGERRASNEFSLRPTRDPSARRRRLTPDAKRPSRHALLRRPKGALCLTPTARASRRTIPPPEQRCARRRWKSAWSSIMPPLYTKAGVLSSAALPLLRGHQNLRFFERMKRTRPMMPAATAEMATMPQKTESVPSPETNGSLMFMP